MAGITTKELSSLEDQLTLEQNLVQKYKMYAQTCSDPQIKTKCEQISAKHQDHFNRLLNQLQ